MIIEHSQVREDSVTSGNQLVKIRVESCLIRGEIINPSSDDYKNAEFAD